MHTYWLILIFHKIIIYVRSKVVYYDNYALGR